MSAAGGSGGKYLNSRNPAIKRIMREWAEFQAEPSTEYVAAPCEDNVFEWHFTLRGAPGTEFEGGRYHGRILLPSEYPFKPPDIILLTPSGRFAPNEKICLSISSFHPKNWQPSWSIRTVLIALIAFFPTPGGGAIGSQDFPIADRKEYARRSGAWKCELCGKTNAQMLPDAAATATAPAAAAKAATATTAVAPATTTTAAAATPAVSTAAGATAADRLVADLIQNLKAATPGQPLPPPVPPSPSPTTALPSGSPPASPAPVPLGAAKLVATPLATAATPLPSASPPSGPVAAPAAVPSSPTHPDGSSDEGWATAPSNTTPQAYPTLSRKPSSGVRSIPLTSRLFTGASPARNSGSASAASPSAATAGRPATQPMSLNGQPTPSSVAAAMGTAASTSSSANASANANPNTIFASIAGFQVPPPPPAASLPPAGTPALDRQWSTPTLGMVAEPPTPIAAAAAAAPTRPLPAAVAPVAAPKITPPPTATPTPTPAAAPAVASPPSSIAAPAAAPAVAGLTPEQMARAELIRREREMSRARKERLLSNLTVTVAAAILLILLRKLLAYSQRHQF